MKKIGIYLTGTPDMGGVIQYEQSVLNTLDTLSNEYDIYAIFYNSSWAHYLKDFNCSKIFLTKDFSKLTIGRIVYGVFKFINLPIANCNYYPYINEVSKKIDDLGLNLLIIPNQEIVPALIRTKSITAIHDLMHRYENFPENNNHKEYKYREYVCKNICESTSVILVDSNVGKQQVIESYGKKYKDKIKVLPYTIPPYLFNNIEKKIDGIPEKFIFYPAQFWKHKNHKNLLLAASKLKKQSNLDINFVFVGSQKNAYQDILNLIKYLRLEKQVKILGYVSNEEMIFLYNNARALLMPTFFGPTNIPPIEGMAMGCPVAVSNIYGMPEQIGDAGLKFNPNSVDEIADILLRLWNGDKLCKSLTQKGYEQAKKFTQNAFNKKLLKIIEDTI